MILWKTRPKKVQPLLDKSGKISAPDFPGPVDFFSALFELCGQNFGPLATLYRMRLSWATGNMLNQASCNSGKRPVPGTLISYWLAGLPMPLVIGSGRLGSDRIVISLPKSSTEL
jgi:hypothetical protein